MPIVALSDITVRAITSSLVLNDAISVVKELIDNALDSRASNICIEVSANTLDIVQVKDNGSGIGLEDRQLLCKRCYTSKIRTLEDLANLGGTFLGFRGEALASVAELSESVTFTTRVEGETAGTLLKFNSHGKLIHSASAHHGTGTTVRVADLLNRIPVRKETAQKKASKTLASIKRLLFDYAFARPTTRFQFKVLKSKSDFKDNWVHVPSKEDRSIILTASKVVGKDVVAHCKQETITSEDGLYCLNGLFVSDKTDVRKLSTFDQYISIDGRPLNAECTFMKELNKIYKTYLRRTIDDDVSLPKKVFLALQLSCPKGTYDVNIEPSKDEVIFEDVRVTIKLFEDICKRIYGEKPMLDKPTKETNLPSGAQKFDLLLARRDRSNDFAEPFTGSRRPSTTTKDPGAVIATRVPIIEGAYADRTSPIKRHQKIAGSIYNALGDSEGKPASIEISASVADQSLSEDEGETTNFNITNPFLLAKLNTRTKPIDSHRPTLNLQNHSPQANPISQQISPSIPYGSQTSTRCSDRRISRSKYSDQPYLNPGPPNQYRECEGLDIGERRRTDSTSSSPVSATTSPVVQPTLIESWTATVCDTSPRLISSEVHVKQSQSTHTNLRESGLKHHLSSAVASSITSGGPQQNAFRTPFKNLQKGSTTFSCTGIPGAFPTPTSLTKNRIRPTSVSNDQNDLSLQPTNDKFTSELEDIMDFEHRKRDSIIQHTAKFKSHRSDLSVRRQADESVVNTVGLNPQSSEKEVPSDIDIFAARFAHATCIPKSLPKSSLSSSKTPRLEESMGEEVEIVRESDREFIQSTGIEALRLSITESISRASSFATATVQGHGLSADDPRAYLINRTTNKSSGLLSARANKQAIAKLPFENISPTFATFNCCAALVEIVPFGISKIASEAKSLKEVDDYVQTGLVQSAFTGASIDKFSFEAWESSISSLLEARCR